MDNQELANKLATLRGKFEFFKAQKADNATKKEKILEEIKSLGMSSVEDLKKSVERLDKEISELEAKLEKAIGQAETVAENLDRRLKGEMPVDTQPKKIVLDPPPEEL
jgi:chromosome segregation ATPase